MIFLVALLPGAIANHTLWVTIHECTHNLVFRSRAGNHAGRDRVEPPPRLPDVRALRPLPLAPPHVPGRLRAGRRSSVSLGGAARREFVMAQGGVDRPSRRSCSRYVRRGCARSSRSTAGSSSTSGRRSSSTSGSGGSWGRGRSGTSSPPSSSASGCTRSGRAGSRSTTCSGRARRRPATTGPSTTWGSTSGITTSTTTFPRCRGTGCPRCTRRRRRRTTRSAATAPTRACCFGSSSTRRFRSSPARCGRGPARSASTTRPTTTWSSRSARGRDLGSPVAPAPTYSH